MVLEAQNLFDTPHPSLQKEWVDSVFNSLTPDQKIGQLFMVAAYSNKNESYYQDLEALIKNFHVGGLVFFQGGPVIQAHLTNRLQRLAKVPLMIAMDGEWGLGMRLDSTISFPRQMTLGAIQDNSLITQMGKEIASQQIRLGVHVNFAPVIDINSNPGNPVIGDRSFGEDKINVSLKGSAYMRGLQRGGIIATAKHFPGHGDTGKDSHKTLPVIKHSKSRLEEMELYPFRQLIDGGLMGMMIAHIHVPALDKKSKVATSISQSVVTGLLKEEMNFTGLVFSDALNMKGVSQYNKPGELDLMALQAGND
ncbi:MAG: glycosyl hydrolase, partial [Bacteroidetes bacterium]|nr:glycosyl hydrolase [Bacteroidota bacterium]